MRYVRLALLAACAATLLSGSALAQSSRSLASPQALKPFLLRANEAPVHDFSRTPSFSWSPVRGAVRYEFQLAKNITFNESSVFWATGSVRGPATAIPLSLPWMTGKPYAAYARVRAVDGTGKVSPWSTPYGFNLRWKDLPKQLPEYPGLSRWTPVEGATGYEVWFTNIGPGFEKHVTMRTNSVDQREAYSFHDSPAWTSTVKWRVRAIRNGEEIVHLNGLPAVYYGPWSPEFISTNPAQSGALQTVAAVSSGATSTLGQAHDHELTPGLAFSGREALNTFGSNNFGLYRVYVATDSDCVNVIFKGAIVGSPAYSPRTSGPLDLPTDPVKQLPLALSTVLKDGKETNTFMAGVVPVTATEQAPADTETAKAAPAAAAPAAAPAAGGTTADTTPKAVDLPESGWPNGRFYWTVVPVKMVIVDDGKTIEYHETKPAQDQCQAGNLIEFGKDSSPVVAGSGTAFASGMSPGGRLVAAVGAKSVFYGRPLVAWQPVQGAAGYEIQWSHKADRWRTLGSLETEGTAVTLPLDPGHWWYRVRARNPYLPGHVKRMAWSTPLAITVAKPKFRLVASSK